MPPLFNWPGMADAFRSAFDRWDAERGGRKGATVTVVLPVPPSLNGAYVNVPRRGRVKSSSYKRWLKVADARVMAQWPELRPLIPIKGEKAITIRIPAKTRGDTSNRTKLAEDYLVSRGITTDDKHNATVTTTRDPNVTECVIEIAEVLT